MERRHGFRALDYRFTVDVTGDDALAAYVPRLFTSLVDAAVGADGADDPVAWHVRARADDDGWELVVDEGHRQATATSAAGLVAELVHALNSLAIPAWDGVVCHAGGVARDGRAVVLPAGMESGKSTLTAGLVRAGFGYLSDEGIAFRRGQNLIEPYPKPISIDPGSWFLFPELEPDEDIGSDDYRQHQWQVPPDAIRPRCVARPCPARLIVFPIYVEGACTELAPMRRAEALVELTKNTFAFNHRSRFALEELAAIVGVVDCHRLTVGDLDDAVALVDELLSSLPEEASTDA